ncbi:hypothetical protein C8R43DRAFT_1113347 [Mycena crocata]|nr:hypothetical protein C8R43DRAFT_1113347 [Mycena crocata]
MISTTQTPVSQNACGNTNCGCGATYRAGLKFNVQCFPLYHVNVALVLIPTNLRRPSRLVLKLHRPLPVLSSIVCGATAIPADRTAILGSLSQASGSLNSLSTLGSCVGTSSGYGTAQIIAQSSRLADQICSLTSMACVLSRFTHEQFPVIRIQIKTLFAAPDAKKADWTGRAFHSLAPHCGWQLDALATAWKAKNAAPASRRFETLGMGTKLISVRLRPASYAGHLFI